MLLTIVRSYVDCTYLHHCSSLQFKFNWPSHRYFLPYLQVLIYASTQIVIDRLITLETTSNIVHKICVFMIISLGGKYNEYPQSKKAISQVTRNHHISEASVREEMKAAIADGCAVLILRYRNCGKKFPVPVMSPNPMN